MSGKNFQTLLVTGLVIILLALLGAVAFLFSQQQDLQRELSSASESPPQGSSSVPVPVSPPAIGPIYGDINFQGEVKEGPVFIFTDWDSGAEIKTVAVFASAEAAGGTSVFKISSDDAFLPKPYTLGTVPNGFALDEGEAFTRLDPDKYRVEITALQNGNEITVLHYLNFSE
ncbi:MAG: hypothetical protein HY475_00530 [Candidatus Terrybacteria bacterium]|nr:hypothetical protein [Candidatus Terrybacteria bacterium]